jgi:hypothetical protein
VVAGHLRFRRSAGVDIIFFFLRLDCVMIPAGLLYRVVAILILWSASLFQGFACIGMMHLPIVKFSF